MTKDSAILVKNVRLRGFGPIFCENFKSLGEISKAQSNHTVSHYCVLPSIILGDRKFSRFAICCLTLDSKKARTPHLLVSYTGTPARFT